MKLKKCLWSTEDGELGGRGDGLVGGDGISTRGGGRDVIHQTRVTVFHQDIKHREES